jgi:hypothetical protein
VGLARPQYFAVLKRKDYTKWQLSIREELSPPTKGARDPLEIPFRTVADNLVSHNASMVASGIGEPKSWSHAIDRLLCKNRNSWFCAALNCRPGQSIHIA